MYGIILKGSLPQREEFIDNFIKSNSIPTYNIVSFEEPLKILDVRQLKSSLNVFSQALRLFIIRALPTIEAQNALLKTLEETAEGVQFIFSFDEELLPTIISRCFIKRLNNSVEAVGTKNNNSSLINSLITLTTPKDKLLILDKILTSGATDSLSDLILALRQRLILEVKSNNNNERVLYQLLKNLIEETKYVKSNNLNERLIIEKILLTSV